MVGVDELSKRGYIDAKKLAVTGGSGGGVLTDWTVTHTDRFAAAVSQRDISNWASWWYTADFTLFQPNWFKAPPFEDPAGLHQPLRHHVRQEHPHAHLVRPRRIRLPHSPGLRR